MCRGKNCFWHQIPSLVESEPILALHGDIVAPHEEASLPGNVSFYSRRTLRVVGQNCYHFARSSSITRARQGAVFASSCYSVASLRELFLAGGFEPEAAIIERRRRGADRQSNLTSRIAQIQRLIDTDKLATPKERDLALP